MSAIETQSLTKRFGDDVLAVDSLDLTVESGEIFGFLGPNGAGKSTTINMLLDFVRPDEGTATVLGFDAQRESDAVRERVGVLPEGASLYDRLTGREHVEWVAETKGANADPDTVLDRVGLDPAARDRKAGGYSKGMGQRLAFGMALVGDPDLLILDEPSTGLDPTGIQEMRDLLREEAESGTTVFFSSHILSQVEAVCDRVGIMNEGRIVVEDTIEGLRDAAGGSSQISLAVEAIPDDLVAAVASLDGVEYATAGQEGDGNRKRETQRITATCAVPTAKVDVIERVNAKTPVLDIHSEGASLEELFNAYTGEGEGASVRNGEGEISGDGERESSGDGEPDETTEVVA